MDMVTLDKEHLRRLHFLAGLAMLLVMNEVTVPQARLIGQITRYSLTSITEALTEGSKLLGLNLEVSDAQQTVYDAIKRIS